MLDVWRTNKSATVIPNSRYACGLTQYGLEGSISSSKSFILPPDDGYFLGEDNERKRVTISKSNISYHRCWLRTP